MRNIQSSNALPAVLLMLRLSVFLVMLMWTVDKFIEPGHAGRIFAHFYGVSGVADVPVYVIGAIEILILMAFAAGFACTVTYGFVLIAHGATTLVSFPNYLAPFTGSNLLFFAAWPMLAAIITLFVLREADTWFSVDARRRAGRPTPAGA